ncbi:MAG: hypothetical protein F9B45_20750 [Phycisphaera sp. RhM]|nr:hypothetical protein [Phycisphaera sp. RhM]
MSQNNNTKTIPRYARRNAIADGMLVDVTSLASNLGFPSPVAVTSAVWMDCIDAPEKDSHFETERLRIVLCWLRTTLHAGRNPNPLHFTTLCENHPAGQVRVTLRAVCHAGDQGEPVLTIMYPDENL